MLSLRRENNYPDVSQPYINRKPNGGKRSNESPQPRLTSRRSAMLWRRRVNGDRALQPGRCVLLVLLRVFSVYHCSKAVCELTHRRVSRRHFPPLLRLLKADTRMGHGHTPSPPARQPQLAAEPPHSATASLHGFISQNITPDMTPSISFNKIQLHSLCLFDRGKSIFLGTTLHYVQKVSLMEACV